MWKKAEVLLLKPLQGKWNAGDIIDVKMHYANYVLIPQGIAIYFDKQAKNQRAAHEKKVLAYKITMKKSVQEMADTLIAEWITFEKQATDANTLYDSVSNKSLSQYVLANFWLTISPESFNLTNKIEELWEFDCMLTFESIKAPFKIIIKKSS